LPDGGILVGGHAADGPFGGSDFALVRYLPDGTPNPDFGDGGRVVTDVAGAGDVGFALTVQPDGKPVLTSRASIDNGSAEVAAVVRYLPDGRRCGSGDHPAPAGRHARRVLRCGRADHGRLQRRVRQGFDVAVQPTDGRVVALGSALNLFQCGERRDPSLGRGI